MTVAVLPLSTLDEASLALQAAHTRVIPNHAFAELYRRHIDRVYRYHYARTSSVQDAQDLTAQTFIAALENIPRYRGDANFSAWLLGIARRKAADFHRQHYQQGTPLPLDEIEDLSQSDLPENLVIEHLQLERVVTVLRAIAPERAEALTLHVFGGLTFPEVAGVMDKSEAAVRMLIHRALNDLRVRLADQE
jgi:RNA polymerase sigma-70 factor (ECF subfamily)